MTPLPYEIPIKIIYGKIIHHFGLKLPIHS